jgi:hypothetical protein
MLFTQADVARQLKVARATISLATEQGRLNHVLLPGHKKPRYTQNHIDKFLAAEERGPKPKASDDGY